MPTLPLHNDSYQDATTDSDIFAECSARLRIAQQAEGENRNNAILALEFEDGQQWPDDLYNLRKINRRPTLTINHTRTMVRRVVNNMRQQRPRIKVHPVGMVPMSTWPTRSADLSAISRHDRMAPSPTMSGGEVRSKDRLGILARPERVRRRQEL